MIARLERAGDQPGCVLPLSRRPGPPCFRPIASVARRKWSRASGPATDRALAAGLEPPEDRASTKLLPPPSALPATSFTPPDRTVNVAASFGMEVPLLSVTSTSSVSPATESSETPVILTRFPSRPAWLNV